MRVIIFCNEIYEHLFLFLSVPSPNLRSPCFLHNSQIAHLPPKLSRGCKAGEEISWETGFSFKNFQRHLCREEKRDTKRGGKSRESVVRCGAHTEQCPVLPCPVEPGASLTLCCSHIPCPPSNYNCNTRCRLAR